MRIEQRIQRIAREARERFPQEGSVVYEAFFDGELSEEEVEQMRRDGTLVAEWTEQSPCDAVEVVER